jgi:5-formyltetrahydrofolate cyclo-ligase
VDSTQSASLIKSELRQRFRSEREFLITESSWQHLLDSKEIKSSQVLASYYSYASEPDTSELNKSLIQSGKTLLLPRRLPDNDLDWIIWTGKDEDLEIDGKVKSPKGESFKGEIDVVIVPALHVDRQGNRLGQGGGSYDRALAKLNSWKVALVYSGELTSEKLPVESFDCKLDAAATPEILVRFTAKN